MKSISPREYLKKTLSEKDLEKSPHRQLEKWWQEAIAAEVDLLDAVFLSSVDHLGSPDARIVLLKSFDDEGLVFFTNYHSHKAIQLSQNPNACMVIFWPELERQIRIRGPIKKTSRDESMAYFNSRPRGAQLSAWASHQSQSIKDRAHLEELYDEISEKYSGKDVPCPDFWGGLRLIPEYFEFWQGRANRLHDRFAFNKAANHWQAHRLAP